MATFTVASLAYDNQNLTHRGQAFTPNVAGPDGTGSPGSATEVFLNDFILGYRAATTTDRAETAYLYDTLPALADLNSGIGAIDVSSSYTDGNVFGTDTYTRTFNFSNPVTLDPTKVYYVLFASNQTARYKNTVVYAGGAAYNNYLLDDSKTLQFKADFSC